MVRNLAIWLLLPAMLLNGLWMVCNSSGETDSLAQSKESADCIRICAALEARFGKICFFLPGDAKTSITIIDFGVAIVPLEFQLQPTAAKEPFVTGSSAVYTNPSLSNHTPPPKA